MLQQKTITMTSIALRKKVHHYVDTTDDKILKAVYTILEEYARSKEEPDTLLTKEQREELDKTLADHKAGKLKYYTADQTRKMLSGKAKK